MVYSVHQAFSHSYNFEDNDEHSDVPTESILVHSAATDACKDISDPKTLLLRASAELQAAAKTTTPMHQQNYWNVWAYWKKHPFLCKDPSPAGQLLLEHFVIVHNAKGTVDTLHADLQTWLHLVSGSGTAEALRPDLVLLREELCTTLYVLVLRPSQALVLLEEAAPPLLPAELFSALKRQLIGNLERIDAKDQKEGEPGSLLFRFSTQLHALFERLVLAVQARYAQLVALLRKQPDLWRRFLQKLLAVILQRLQRLLF